MFILFFAPSRLWRLDDQIFQHHDEEWKMTLFLHGEQLYGLQAMRRNNVFYFWAVQFDPVARPEDRKTIELQVICQILFGS